MCPSLFTFALFCAGLGTLMGCGWLRLNATGCRKCALPPEREVLGREGQKKSLQGEKRRWLEVFPFAPHSKFPVVCAMSGSNGVFTAFPDKVHRHWKSFAVAFIAVSAFLYVVIPSNNEDVAFDVSGGCLSCWFLSSSVSSSVRGCDHRSPGPVLVPCSWITAVSFELDACACFCVARQSFQKSTPHLQGGHEVVAEVFVPGPKQPLNAPYGGKLVNVMASPQRAEEVRKSSTTASLVEWLFTAHPSQPCMRTCGVCVLVDLTDTKSNRLIWFP